MEVKLVIDGAEVELESNGKTKSYERFKAPDMGKDRPLIATVYVKPDWKPWKAE